MKIPLLLAHAENLLKVIGLGVVVGLLLLSGIALLFSREDKTKFAGQILILVGVLIVLGSLCFLVFTTVF